MAMYSSEMDFSQQLLEACTMVSSTNADLREVSRDLQGVSRKLRTLHSAKQRQAEALDQRDQHRANDMPRYPKLQQAAVLTVNAQAAAEPELTSDDSQTGEYETLREGEYATLTEDNPCRTSPDIWCVVQEVTTGQALYVKAFNNFKTAVVESAKRLGRDLVLLEPDPPGVIPQIDKRRCDQPVALMVPCLISNNAHTNVTSVLEKLKIEGARRQVLVCFCPRAPHDTRVQPTSKQLPPDLACKWWHVFDVVFNRTSGELLQIPVTRNSIDEFSQKLSEDIQN